MPDTEKRYALLLPVGEVPEGGEITKRGGETRYKVVSKISFTRPLPDVCAEKGVKFLLKVDEPTSSVYGILETTLAHWWLTPRELQEWVRRKLDGPPQ